MAAVPFSEYPRDLAGYGRNPPDPRWPGNARVAVQFVINFEEGGENCILHGDKASEAFLTDVLGAQPWPGQRHMNVELMFEYGSRAGFWRLWRLFAARKIPATVFGVATALARNPQIVAAMREAGWDIASHGLKWIDYKDFSREDESAHMREAIRIHTEATGERPLGLVHRPQLRTHAEARARRRRLSLFVGFLCRRSALLGQRPKGPHLIIPYSLDANDMRFINPQGFADGESFFAYLRDTFDCLYAEGETQAEDDVGRAALPAGRTAGTGRGPGAVFRLHRQIRPRLDADAARHRAALAPRASCARRRCAGRRLRHGDRHGANHPRRTQPAWTSAPSLRRIGDMFELAPWVAEEPRVAARPFPSLNALYDGDDRRGTRRRQRAPDGAHSRPSGPRRQSRARRRDHRRLQGRAIQRRA